MFKTGDTLERQGAQFCSDLVEGGNKLRWHGVVIIEVVGGAISDQTKNNFLHHDGVSEWDKKKTDKLKDFAYILKCLIETFYIYIYY